MSAFFALAGANHFLHPGIYLRIMPPYLPFPLPLIYLSGFLESALGLALWVPSFRRPAAWGLVVLLALIFPANLHMAFHAALYPAFNPIVLWLRLPFQFVLMALILWSAGPRNKAGVGSP